VQRRRPRVFANIDDIEDMLAAVNAAEEAARLLALRATRAIDLIEADTIRVKLALIWVILDRERQSYGREKAEEEE
jgi:hypothetical protein